MTPLPCPHNMPNAATCVDCIEAGPVATPEQWTKVGAPFTAAFAGTCVGCDATEISPGQQVQRWDRGPNRTAYVHARCAP